MRSLLLQFILGVFATWSAAYADTRPSAAAVRAASPLRIDGALDEAAWSAAEPIGAFLLMQPREGQAPDESTSVRVLVDGDRIVFGIWCQARRALRASLVPRDQITDGDYVSVHLDTDGDGQRAYIFGVNPYSVQLDGILTSEADFKWDGVWEAAARRGDGAWTAEIAVPFRILRISASGRPWRLWIRREIAAWNEVSTWPPYRIGDTGRIMLQAADLTGLDDVRGGHALTIEPYAFASALGARAALPSGDLGGWSSDDARNAGLDVQAAVTRALVLNATWDPDFSQIEADALQIDVNQRYPLQYPEKRPFFLEGGENFTTPMNLVYTRRMADPHWGAKLAGRLGAWNTGALIVRDLGGGLLAGSGFGSEDVSRPGYFAIARASLPFGKGNNVGVLAGAHTQDAPQAQPGGAAFGERGTLNQVEAADAQLRLTENWSFEGQFGYSAMRMDSALAGSGQTRRESFDDVIGVIRWEYRDKARDWRGGYRYVGPHYRDELGFQDRVGVHDERIGGNWDLFPKTGALQRVSPVWESYVIHDRTGRIDFADLNPYLDVAFRRNAALTLGGHHYIEHWLSHTYFQERAHVFASWSGWRPLALDLEAQVGDGIYYGDSDASSFLAWQEAYTLNATARPTPRISLATNVQRLRLAHTPTSGDVIDLWLVAVRTTAQFSRQLYARVYPQYDSITRHLALNGLVAYVVHPGSVVYVGANSGWEDVQQRRRAMSRQFFAKASWRFSL